MTPRHPSWHDNIMTAFSMQGEELESRVTRDDAACFGSHDALHAGSKPGKPIFKNETVPHHPTHSPCHMHQLLTFDCQGQRSATVHGHMRQCKKLW